MKKILLLISYAVVFVFKAIANDVAEAHEFVYEGIIYSVLDGANKTCRSKSCGKISDESISSGMLVLPAYPADTVAGLEVKYSLVEIGASTFSDCQQFNGVSIPETVKKISSYAFAGSNLYYITLPSSLTEIGDEAFISTPLTSIAIPGSVSEIGTGVFSRCELLEYAEIGEGVWTLPNDMFSFSGLKSISLPSTLKYIENATFLSCNQLKECNLPESLIEIGSYAFLETGLESIEIPNSVTKIGSSALGGCTSLKNIKLGDAITEIPEYCFVGCTAIKNVNIPSSVERIRQMAFAGCGVIESFHIDDATTLLMINPYPNDAFADASINKLYMGRTCENGSQYYSIFSDVKALTIGEDVTNVRMCYWPSLSELIVQSENIDLYPFDFEGCLNLKSVALGKDNSKFSCIDGVLFNKDGSSVLFFPPGREGEYVLPERTTEIGYSAFYGSAKLESVVLPSSISTILTSAFKHSGITSLTIPEMVKIIPTRMCEGCENLNTVTIPKGLEIIDTFAFAGCSGLTDIYYDSDMPIEGTEAVFSDITYSNATLHMSKKGFEASADLIPWCLFSNRKLLNDNAVNGILYEKSEIINIYDLSGMELSSELDSLKPGTYIVKKTDSTIKMVIR